MTHLEVPRLNVQQFEMIVTAEDQLPTTLAIRVKLFLRRHFVSDAGSRLF
jgi:hypothetical protein